MCGITGFIDKKSKKEKNNILISLFLDIYYKNKLSSI